MTADFAAPLGANLTPGGANFRIWAPGHSRVAIVLYYPSGEEQHQLSPEGDGYYSGTIAAVTAGTRYGFRFGDESQVYPDPTSRFQPEGVHGPSQVIDPTAFEWTDADWRGPCEDPVIYELHVGTATLDGTFDSLIPRLRDLAALGVNTLELMPVANFPGQRNWGYDGVNLFAPATVYGGPEALRRLVDAAHGYGMAVILDVVYNHLGPEGNYLPLITNGHFFTDRHRTPWGDAVNFDGPESGPVRDFVIENAIYWIREYHLDGLRLDATHAIIDDSPLHILSELTDRVRASTSRPVLLIAEDERDAQALVTPTANGGMGMDAVWADDFHHQLRRLVAGDSEGYFADYSGTVADLVKTIERGWFDEGQQSGSGSAISPPSLVHCIQNHDQVGNRPYGDRLSDAVDGPVYRAASALLLLSPYTPLLWMGQEWSASTPFLYFTDHPDELGKLVTAGRREEFKKFSAFNDPDTREKIPDPQDEGTFLTSKLDWTERERPGHAGVLALYEHLLRLRRSEPTLRMRARGSFDARALGKGSLALRRTDSRGEALLLVVCFRGEIRVDLTRNSATAAPEETRWRYLLATEESRFGGCASWGRMEPDGVLHLTSPGAILLNSSA